MKSLKFIHSLMLILASLGVSIAQSDLDAIVKNVLQNNTTIQVQKNKIDADKIGDKIGTTLYDPYVSFDFMRGSPYAVAGNQTDINLEQRFDYPTVYNKKKLLNLDKSQAADIQQAIHVQFIVIEVKKIYNALVFHNKKQSLLALKKSKADDLVNAYQMRLDKGDGNRLEVNKARLLVLEATKAFKENQTTIAYLQQLLSEYNGGKVIIVTDTIYPLSAFNVVTEADLFDIMTKGDYQHQLLQQQLTVLRSELAVNKASNLPKFGFGYHYQGVLGQNFHGAKLGMSIPIWENKYTIDYKNAQISSQEILVKDHQFRIQSALKRTFEKYEQLTKIKDEYLTNIQAINNLPLLDKALRLGEITLMEYLFETKYIFDANATYLDLERECNDLIIELTKYRGI